MIRKRTPVTWGNHPAHVIEQEVGTTVLKLRSEVERA